MPSLAYLVSQNPFLGGEYYRGYRPAAIVGQRLGWHTAVCNKMGYNSKRDRLSFVTFHGVVVQPDIIVLRPIGNWRLRDLDQARNAGQVVLADLDDDVWGHEEWSDATRPNDDHFDEWFPFVDGVLASTEVMASICREHTRAPVVVAPNCYDPFGFGQADPQPGRTLGTRMWMSARMKGDMVLYDELFLPLLERYDLRWMHIGGDEPLPPWGGTRTFPERGWPEELCETTGSISLLEMHTLLTRMSMGCIAMCDQRFNAAKTETHAVELGSAGLPLVAATNHPLYAKVPGRVPLDAGAVKDRVFDLLSPKYWRRGSARTREWAVETAQRCEALYIEALLDLVAYHVKV